jgi:hypothetical protein
VILLVVASAFVLVAALLLRAHRRERALAERIAGMASELRDLGARLAATEDEVGRAVAQGEIAENLLVEKGVADEDDVEAMRARHDAAGSSGYVRLRDGDLH